jgi:hypothetical protein
VRIGTWLDWDTERLLWIDHYKSKGRFSMLDKHCLMILSFVAQSSQDTDEYKAAFLKETAASVRSYT